MILLRLKETTGGFRTSIFDLVNDEKIVGIVQLRHSVSAGVGVPQECASHIYYEVHADERGKGYGKKALELALEEAKKVGMSSIVVTCEKSNLASKRIIEVNKGVYTKSCTCDDGRVLLRYEF